MSEPDQPTRYRVTAPYVLATTRAGIGSILTGKPAPCEFMADMILPDDVPEHQLRHLLDSQMIEPVAS